MNAPGPERSAWATTCAVGALLAIVALRFREAVFNFFFFDDFWELTDAAQIRLNSAADLIQFFRPSHAGFLMYRPLTTVGYFWFLRQLFGYDTSAYHAFQVGVFAINAVLVLSIVLRLTDSRLSALGAGLLFVLAPGQMIAVNWLAAFTVTGTASVLLLMVWCYLHLNGVARVAACTLLQAVALLASEHGIVGPLLLAALAVFTEQRERWDRIARILAPPTLIVAVYLALKVGYFWSAGIKSSYAVTFDARVWMSNLGRYLTYSCNFLALARPNDATCFSIGVTVVGAASLAAWRYLRGARHWRLLAIGLAFFVIALLPVAGLGAHNYPQYVAFAAAGFALAVVGLLRLANRHWRSLTLAVAIGVLALDYGSAGRAWRADRTFHYITIPLPSILWIQTVQSVLDSAGSSTEIWVPAEPMTRTMFSPAVADALLPDAAGRIRVYATYPLPQDGRYVITESSKDLDRHRPIPGCDARWDWLRKLAAAGEDPADMWQR